MQVIMHHAPSLEQPAAVGPTDIGADCTLSQTSSPCIVCES